jgi:hypothetical protein
MGDNTPELVKNTALVKVLVVGGLPECAIASSADSSMDPGCKTDAPLGLPPP